MTFLPPAMTAAANRYVMAQDPDRRPTFPRKTYAGAVEIGGSLLRYSTTTPVVVIPIPGGFRIPAIVQTEH